MNKDKFIKLISPHATETMKKYNILASLQIAQVILETGWGESELFTKANNPAGVKGTYNGDYYETYSNEYINGEKKSIKSKFRKYPTLQEGFDDKVNVLMNSKNKGEYRYRNLIGISDYKEATKTIMKDGYATDPKYNIRLNEIIEQNKLYEFDDIKESEDIKNNTVEVDKVADEDLFRVRKSVDAANSQLGAFKNKDAAIELCNKHIGYKVFNLRGVVVHTSTAKDPNIKDTSIKLTKSLMVKGQPIKLSNTPLYISSVIKTKSKNISGTYYVYDGKEYTGNRYRICSKKEYVGKGTSYILGYIDLDDVK